MYVKLRTAPAYGVRVPGMSEKYREDGLDFPESGVVQVDAPTGEALVDHVPGVAEHTPNDGNSSRDSDSE